MNVVLTNLLQFNDLGEYRVVFALPPEIAVDAHGTGLGQKWAADQRLRAGFQLAGASWRATTEWDFLAGQFAGDPWDIGGHEDERGREGLYSLTLAGVRPRQAVIGFDLPIGKLDVGLQTSNWGLGLVANDGMNDPLFGRSDFGDRVIRARFLTKPADPLILIVAADLVAADDTADLFQHQAAIQGVVATLWTPSDATRLGIYGVYRHQIEGAFDAGTSHFRSNLGVLDIFAHQTVNTTALNLDLGAEAAGIVGSTTRARTYTSPEGLSVLSGGAALKATAEESSKHLALTLSTGFLSGDANPDDGGSHAFSADRDFDVGMVLFDEVQGAYDAAAYALVTDSQYSGKPPDGADAMVSEGAVRGATWIQPVLTVKPVPLIQVRIGGVFGWSTAPVSQAFETVRAGGVPTNALGQATEGYALGNELDWAVVLGDSGPPTWSPAKTPKPRPSLVLQGGHAWLSDNFGGTRADLYMAVGRFRL